MLTQELMHPPPIVIRQDTPLRDVAQMMLDKHVECIPVVDENGELCGMVTDREFAPRMAGVPFSIERLPQVFGDWMRKAGIEEQYRAAGDMTAEDIMQAHVTTVSEGTPIWEALDKMLHRSVRCLIVVRDNVPVGVVSYRDLLFMMV
jgi:CBS domain-containing protein